MISFASFENDGSTKKFTSLPRNGGARPLVLPEDLQQHRQYAKIGTEVQFLSLKDFDKCENVEEFLEEVRQKKITDPRKTKGSTSLFLQDFPSGGNYVSNILLL